LEDGDHVRSTHEINDGGRRLIRLIGAWLLSLLLATAEPASFRVVAANLTSDNAQTYSPDNGNQSNPEGAGARILKALKPDIVLIQEFTTTVPVRQWVNATFGEACFIFRESGKALPNGIISRYPILAAGSWDDPVLDNREFAWARLVLPGGQDLWVVSVHLHSRNAASRHRQSEALVAAVKKSVPRDALLIIGGDLNTRHFDEPCFQTLAKWVKIPARPPADSQGNTATNLPRNRPYDWVLASPTLDRRAVPVSLAGLKFPDGLVFDTREFPAINRLHPAQPGDSGLKMMQHMAVVRDFGLP
jgi:endonuclease/exonuclease/phosphatase family metal-dependent hydrolase